MGGNGAYCSELIFITAAAGGDDSWWSCCSSWLTSYVRAVNGVKERKRWYAFAGKGPFDQQRVHEEHLGIRGMIVSADHMCWSMLRRGW